MAPHHCALLVLSNVKENKQTHRNRAKKLTGYKAGRVGGNARIGVVENAGVVVHVELVVGGWSVRHRC